MKAKLSNQSKGFTISEVWELTKVSERKLRWWDQQGLAKASAFPERKRWQTRRYTLQDIVCVLVVKTLRERGISLQRIRETVNRVSVTGVDMPLAKLRAACLANSVILKINGKFIDPISGQYVIEEALETIRPHIKPRSLASVERDVEQASIHYEEMVAHF
jgi:DNA-binding transcriptional MerR regulator